MTTTIEITLPPETYTELQALAEKHAQTVNAIITEAITKYLRAEKDAAALQGANARLDDFFKREPMTNAPESWQRAAKPKRKKRKASTFTAKYLGETGEAICKDVFAARGIKLHKINVEYVPAASAAKGYAVYRAKDVDFVDSNDTVKVEAKTWWRSHKPRFDIGEISSNQRDFLDKAVNHNYNACVCIVELNAPEKGKAGCDTVYIIPWLRWLELEKALKAKSKGSYKGASIRAQDMDLLEPYAVRREGKGWPTQKPRS